MVDVWISWPVVGSLVTGIGTLFLIYYLGSYWDKPGAKWFILALFGQATFCFAYGIGLTVFDPTIRLWFEIVALVGLSWLGVPFLAFALGYTGRGNLLDSWQFRSLLGLPLFATVMMPLNPWHNLLWTDFQVAPTLGVATVSYSFQPIAYFGMVGAAVFVSIGTLLLFDTVLSYGPMYRREALAVALSPVPPILGLGLWLSGVGMPGHLNVVALFMLPHVVLDAYAFVGSGMFEFHPATNRTAERSAIDSLSSPVFVLDEEGRIVELNEAAQEQFGVDRETAVTRPIATLVDREILPNEETTRLSYRQGNRPLEFRVESTPLCDSRDQLVGYTLLFQDVTDAVRRKERLSVLNRVLRHNLRNDLTVVNVYVEEAAARSDEETAEMLQKARRKVDGLVDTSNTARKIEDLLDSEMRRDEAVVLDRRLITLLDDFRGEHPGATFSMECPSVAVETNWDLLSAVLTELLENAVEHTESDEPVVTVTAEQANGRVEIAVRDTGPGIPDHELQTLERGTETALEHGSGLGLWLVRWGTIRLGGDVEFRPNGNGTTALIELPAESVSTS